MGAAAQNAPGWGAGTPAQADKVVETIKTVKRRGRSAFAQLIAKGYFSPQLCA